MRIVLIVAMDKEYEELKNLNSCDVMVVKGGIGKVNAALKAKEIIDEYRPDVIISTGVAGGGHGVNIGDVVVAEKSSYHDVYCGSEVKYGCVMGMPLYYESSQMILDAIDEIEKPDFGKIHKGLIVTGDWFVDDISKAESIISKFPQALAIDMETAAIAQTCYKSNTAFCSIRAVSDLPLGGENRGQYDDFWGNGLLNKYLSVPRNIINKLTNKQ